MDTIQTATQPGESCAGCRQLLRLGRELEEYRGRTDERLRKGDVTLATINTKLNWLIGILSGLGAAVLTVILRLLTGMI